MNTQELENYLNTENKSGYKTREKHIKNKFPELYTKIINYNGINWFEKLYNYIYNLTENKKCIECGKILHIRKYNLGYSKYCSTICKNKNNDFKELIKKTWLSKYGVDNPSKSNEIKERIKNKLYKNGKWYHETEECRNKAKLTCLKKYGVDHFSKTKKFHEKRIKTNIEKYGVDSYNKTIEYKENMKKNNLIKYGTEWFLSTDEFKEKSKKTCLIKYGVNSHTKTDEYKNKMKKYYLEKYGVVCSMQIKEFKEKMISTMISKYGEVWLNYAPKYNINSIVFLDKISNKLNLPIQHALNGGEKKFIKYWIDGYIEKYNICIEWDEKHHNAVRQKERDAKKDQFLREKFNCNIIRINEHNFLEDVEVNTNNICNLIIEKIQ